MPKPILKENNLIAILNDNIILLKQMDTTIDITNSSAEEKILFVCDGEQLGRVFFN